MGAIDIVANPLPSTADSQQITIDSFVPVPGYAEILECSIERLAVGILAFRDGAIHIQHQGSQLHRHQILCSLSA